MRIVVLVAVALVVLVIVGAGENISLTTAGEVPTYELQNGIAVQTTMLLPTNSTQPVTGCTDMKHYLAYQTRVDGRDLLVIDGQFRLDRHSFIGSWKLPMVYFC
jgi:hypothetical protein